MKLKTNLTETKCMNQPITILRAHFLTLKDRFMLYSVKTTYCVLYWTRECHGTRLKSRTEKYVKMVQILLNSAYFRHRKLQVVSTAIELHTNVTTPSCRINENKIERLTTASAHCTVNVCTIQRLRERCNATNSTNDRALLCHPRVTTPRQDR